MKISQSNRISLIKTYASQSKFKKPGEEQAKKATGTKVGDQAVISPEAREMQAIMTNLHELPEVREDLVNSLKDKIRDGSYHPDNLKIAEGIIREYKPDSR